MTDRGTALLVNPYIEDFAAYDHFSKPLGLLHLASYLKEHFKLYFVNALSRTVPGLNGMKFRDDGTGPFPFTYIETPDLIKDIPRRFKRYGIDRESFFLELKNVPFNPEYIFLTSGMTYWYTGLAYTAGLLRSFFPESKIVLGGIYAALIASHAMKNIDFDYIIPAQGISNVLAELEKITGLTFLSIPKEPAYDLLGEYYYAPVLTSSGCVFNCAYCAVNFLNSFSHSQSPFSMSAGSIISLCRDYGVKNIAFYDDALLYDSVNHIDKVLETVLESGVKARFFTPNGLHIRFLTGRTAALMKQAGFSDIRLSLESQDRAFLEAEGYKADMREFACAMDILSLAGFGKKEIKCYLLVNVPGQDAPSIEQTMNSVNSLGAVPMLAYFSPIPHTRDFQKAQRITDVEEPLFQNNNVYLYRSGFDMEYLKHLKTMEISMRKTARSRG
ncbi:MAG: radical SAM protein [Brevinematales bacterium]|jgi:radical SAM superfamily enzyme YgiQ (UPF0313 family)